MKFIEGKDEKGNHWKLKTIPQEKYPHKQMLHLYLNDKAFKVMNFVTVRECNMFWDLLKTHYNGEIQEEKKEEVNDAKDAN